MKRTILTALIVGTLDLLSAEADEYDVIDVVSPVGGETFHGPWYGHHPVDIISVRWQTRAPVDTNLWVTVTPVSSLYYPYMGEDFETVFMTTNSGSCEIDLTDASQYFRSAQCVIRVIYSINGQRRSAFSKPFDVRMLQSRITLITPTIWSTITTHDDYLMQWNFFAGELPVDGFYVTAFNRDDQTYQDLTPWQTPQTNTTFLIKAGTLKPGNYSLAVEAIGNGLVVGTGGEWVTVQDDVTTPASLHLQQSTNSMLIKILGQNTRSFDIESSTDLRHWARINAQPLKGGWTYQKSTLVPHEYYRAVLAP